MGVVSADPDLSDRLDVIVDPEAKPVDIDDALAEFWIAFIEVEPNN